jgi:predicted 3-demethylubiquinone-9 3-methyltransferase (glyoxalase superfamily)
MNARKISPCLWLDNNAKEAAEFYCSVFPGSRILDESLFVVRFEALGEIFMCLNGGPEFKFSEATSFVIDCETQDEIDYYWNRLTEGGVESQCGWLKDKYGLSWQVVPKILGQLMSDPVRAPRVTEAFLKMKKFDIKTLENV